LSVATEYVRRGWAVFPVGRDKRPLTPNGLKDATTDRGQIARWRSLRPAGIAIRTGDGLVVLDVDGEEGADSLREREREYGDLPHTVRAITPGGGEHHYFAVSRAVPCSVGKVGSGLDIRGDGGYVVVPPSVHSSGRRYEWDVPPDEAELAPLPPWLAALAGSSAHGSPGARPASEWRRVAQGVEQGQRNQACARLCGHLLARGVDHYVALELLVGWDASANRPPLGRQEITRTCESIAARELAKGGHRVGA